MKYLFRVKNGAIAVTAKTNQCQRLPKSKFSQSSTNNSSKIKPVKAAGMASKPARICSGTLSGLMTEGYCCEDEMFALVARTV